MTRQFCIIDAAAIAVGGGYFLVIKRDGTVWGWGDNDCGQLGDGTGETYSDVSIQGTGLTNIAAIAARGLHSLALKKDGTNRCRRAVL